MSSRKKRETKKISKDNFHDRMNELTKVNFQADEMLRKNPDKFWSSKISDEVKFQVVKDLIADMIIDCDNPDDFRIKVLKEIARDYK